MSEELVSVLGRRSSARLVPSNPKALLSLHRLGWRGITSSVKRSSGSGGGRALDHVSQSAEKVGVERIHSLAKDCRLMFVLLLGNILFK